MPYKDKGWKAEYKNLPHDQGPVGSDINKLWMTLKGLRYVRGGGNYGEDIWVSRNGTVYNYDELKRKGDDTNDDEDDDDSTVENETGYDYDVTNTSHLSGVYDDIPYSTGPGKFSKQNIEAFSKNFSRTREAAMRGMNVIMKQQYTVDGKPVTRTTTLAKGNKANGTYVVNVTGEFKHDGTPVTDRKAEFTFPPLPGTGESTETVSTSATGSSGGASGSGGGGGGGGTGGGGGGTAATDSSDGNTTSTGSTTDTKPVTDTDTVTSTDAVNNRSTVLRSAAAGNSKKWDDNEWQSSQPIADALKEFAKKYLTLYEQKLIKSAPQNSTVIIRFRFYDNTFDNSGHENYTEYSKVLRNGNPDEPVWVYGVEEHGATSGSGQYFGGSTEGRWETYEPLKRDYIPVLPYLQTILFPTSSTSSAIKRIPVPAFPTIPTVYRSIPPRVEKPYIPTPPTVEKPYKPIPYAPNPDMLCFICFIGEKDTHKQQGINDIVNWLKNNPEYGLEIESDGGENLWNNWNNEVSSKDKRTMQQRVIDQFVNLLKEILKRIPELNVNRLKLKLGNSRGRKLKYKVFKI